MENACVEGNMVNGEFVPAVKKKPIRIICIESDLTPAVINIFKGNSSAGTEFVFNNGFCALVEKSGDTGSNLTVKSIRAINAETDSEDDYSNLLCSGNEIVFNSLNDSNLREAMNFIAAIIEPGGMRDEAGFYNVARQSLYAMSKMYNDHGRIVF